MASGVRHEDEEAYNMQASGPLRGVKVLEFAGMGPAPFGCMMLSDLGAEVLRIERKGAAERKTRRIDERGRRTIALDLKHPDAVTLCCELGARADVLVEGFRPGTMERLGLGPDVLHAANPALIYARMTGWGQYGPLAAAAGHDINYIALSGALHAIGTEHKPLPPLNLAGDYGGGSMFLVVGVLAALLHARATGEGQVVDAAMTDGAAYLMTMFHGMLAQGDWIDRRRANHVDGGAAFYDTYECADGKWVAVGAIEPHFFDILAAKIGAPDLRAVPASDREAQQHLRDRIAAIFKTRSQQEWCEILEGSDACFAPVLSIADAPSHDHNRARSTFVEVDGIVQPAPAPRFSRTPGAIQSPPRPVGHDLKGTLEAWGVARWEVTRVIEGKD